MLLNYPVKITSKMNGMAITHSQGENKTKAGTLIVGHYTGAVKQKFMVTSAKQVFMIKCLMNNNFIDVEGGSSVVYTPVLCYKGHGNKNQLWRLVKENSVPDAYKIQNLKSGQVLEIEGGIDHEGMRVVQNTYYKNLNQLWKIEQI